MKIVLTFIIVVSLLIPRTVLADCPNAVSLKVGDKVTDCDRIGLSLPYDLKVRQSLVEGDYNLKIIEQKDRLITAKDLALKDADEQKILYRDEANRARKDADDARASANTRFWIGVGVGFLAILGGAWAVGQVK